MMLRTTRALVNPADEALHVGIVKPRLLRHHGVRVHLVVINIWPGLEDLLTIPRATCANVNKPPALPQKSKGPGKVVVVTHAVNDNINAVRVL